MPANRPPNILVIMADQLRRQALGCYGDPNIATPHIDRLSREGVTFDAACSTYPVCVPFRFSFMTGQYAHTRFVPGLTWRMSPAERTLADEFNAAGYHTAYIGKWHLDGVTDHHGFPRFIPRSRQGRWRKWLAFELRNAHFDTILYEDDDPTPRRFEGYQTDILFHLTMRHLDEERPKDRPFCCVVSVEPPHFPYEAPAEYIAKWKGRPLRLPPSFEHKPDYPIPEGHWPGDDTHSAEIKQDRVRTYYAMIQNLDDNVGRMRAFLDRAGLADNTVVVFLSDHGEMGGAHGLPTAEKCHPFEESIAIPLIARDPRQAGQAGRRIADPVCTEDIFPTLCGLAGLTPRDAMPGINLAPLIRGDAQSLEREGVLLEHVHDFRPPSAHYQRPYRGIRTRRWKYAVLKDGVRTAPWLLFDLERDPYEMDNRVADPKLAAERARLHELLRQRLTLADDHFELTPEPPR